MAEKQSTQQFHLGHFLLPCWTSVCLYLLSEWREKSESTVDQRMKPPPWAASMKHRWNLRAAPSVSRRHCVNAACLLASLTRGGSVRQTGPGAGGLAPVGSLRGSAASQLQVKSKICAKRFFSERDDTLVSIRLMWPLRAWMKPRLKMRRTYFISSHRTHDGTTWE